MRSSRPCRSARSSRRRRCPRRMDRAVVEDRVLLVGVDERCAEAPDEVAVAAVLRIGVRRGRQRQAEERDVEAAENRVAPGEGLNVPAQGARRVLRDPPAVDRGEVARDCRRELDVAVGAVRRDRVDGVELVRRDRVGQAVGCRLVGPAPARRCRRGAACGGDRKKRGRSQREDDEYTSRHWRATRLAELLRDHQQLVRDPRVALFLRRGRDLDDLFEL